jgi:hypothetical protein
MQWRPSKRRDFVKKLKRLGFEGPYSGSRHQFLVLGHHRLTIPSNSEYSVMQVKMMLKQVKQITGNQINLSQWESL